MIKHIKKRDGSIVEFDAAKANRWAEWAAGLGIEWGSIVLGAARKVFDGCTTKQWTLALISECLDRETTKHLKMAGRFYMGDVYKEAFGSWRSIPTVHEMYNKMTMLGFWEHMDYSAEELAYCESFIDHSRDLKATLTESKQIMDKYAVVDRVDMKLYESPQFVYMRMALGVMKDMPKDRRMEDVRNMYQKWSLKRINPPSPFSTNLGTNRRKYASCCTFTTLDTAPSLAAADHIAYMMTCASAGIGSHMITRSKGDKVQGGAIVHMGKKPYLKVQQVAVSANLQANRGGANTAHILACDPEMRPETGAGLLKLKNVQTEAEERIKDIDYSFGSNVLFGKKVAKNEDWMLISYGDCPEFVLAMYWGDQDKFEELYNKVEADKSIPRKYVNARELAAEALTEGVETGRYYLHNTDEMNRHTPFKETVWSSNLCQEIGLVSKGYQSVAELYEYAEGNGEIGLCSLSAIDADTPDEEYEEAAYYAALSIDNVMSIMDYPFPQLKYTAERRRSIGVGLTNLAYAMAKRGLRYDTLEGKQFVHRIAERHSYFLHKASIRLAKERGACEWLDRTKYADGWLPIDTANKEIDKLVQQALIYDWEALRIEGMIYGYRFSVLEAHMPCESSAVASGHTNGLYPIRTYKVIKTSGTNKTLFIAPELDELKDKYQLAWDISNIDLIHIYAIVQKFTGQAISADFYLKLDGEVRTVGTKQLLTEFLLMKKLGVKTRYYYNSKTRSEMDEIYAAVAQEEAEPECDTCSL
jgi:ribonucleoside-diphosphate reductase alpha chain